MSTDRPAFRPNHARASLSAIPSTGGSTAFVQPNKENGLSTSTLSASTSTQTAPGRKKRAQSLGGDALGAFTKRTKLEELRAEATMNFELSPTKAERRKAAPRRSILKSVGAVFDNNTLNFGSVHRPVLDPGSATTDLSGLSVFAKKPNRRRSSIKPAAGVADPVEQYDDSDNDQDDDDDPNGSLDMEITRMDITVAYDREGRRMHRASHSRRVSFAPAAHVRHFSPDKATAEAQTAAAARAAAENAALALAEQTGDTSFLANTSGATSDSDASSDSEEEDPDAIESEPSMEIAGDEVTFAFKGHFAGTQVPVSAITAAANANDSASSEDEDGHDEDGTMAMDEVTSNVTEQFLPIPQGQQPLSAPDHGVDSAAAPSLAQGHRPRFSTIVRQEDDEDEEIMRSLGFARGGKPRKSRVGLAPQLSAHNDDSEGEDEDEDEEGSDMEDDDGTAAMEMTTAVGGIISQQSSVPTETSDDEAESAEVSMQLIGTGGTNSADNTMDMVEATASYGSILTAPLPRRSIGPASQPQAGPERSASPRRANTASPPKSPAASLPASTANLPPASRAQSVPLGGDAALFGTPSKSPFRRSSGYGSFNPRRSSPLPSPRRVLTANPAAPAQAVPPRSPARQQRLRSRSASPNKGPFAPPSSLAAKTPRKTPTPSPGPPTRRSVSPAKTVPTTTVAAQGRPRPSLAAGRSPGGSLSLKGLMAQQQMASQSQSQTGRDLESAGRDLNLTGSEFDASFDATTDVVRPPASIEEFFAETGTEFVNDVIGMTGGFDLNSSRVRRKSLAASAFGDESKERAPPTFADMVVAGACQSVLYDLYRNDQQLLLERMQECQQEYNEIDEFVNSETPIVFKTWASASDEEKLNLKNQFAQIKLYHLVSGQVEWKNTRNENMSQIVAAMEQSLTELRRDRAELNQFEIGTVIPSLEERHAALHAELMTERGLDEELTSYTQDQREELAQLHADIEEQEEQISGNRSKGIPGARPQFERIEQQLQKDRQVLESEREKEQAVKERIAELEAALKDKRTKADLNKMKAEFEALQELHGWTLVRFTSSMIQLEHLDELEVAFELDPATLNVVNAEFGIAENRQWSNPLALDVTNYLVGKISERVGEEIRDGRQDPLNLLHLISSQALVLRHVRHEVSLASLEYPIYYSPTTETLELEVYSAQSRKAFLVSVPMSEIELDLPGGDKHKWAEHLSAEIQVKFGGNIGSAGLAINERLNDCEGLVAALRAGEQVCSVTA
ncbi:uncharacterized protein JCM15063_001374 [Sporobolomyces koalae]|uniref:uncharacterized protein n=1 Tax=Sporobolomyces koalae TaxID=500713 RepID=UPI00317C7602